MAAPVAATPLTVCFAGAVTSGGVVLGSPVDESPPPPQADNASTATLNAMGVNLIISSPYRCI
jgi:hypothetical protein